MEIKYQLSGSGKQVSDLSFSCARKSGNAVPAQTLTPTANYAKTMGPDGGASLLQRLSQSTNFMISGTSGRLVYHHMQYLHRRTHLQQIGSVGPFSRLLLEARLDEDAELLAPLAGPVQGGRVVFLYPQHGAHRVQLVIRRLL